MRSALLPSTGDDFRELFEQAFGHGDDAARCAPLYGGEIEEIRLNFTIDLNVNFY